MSDISVKVQVISLTTYKAFTTFRLTILIVIWHIRHLVEVKSNFFSCFKSYILETINLDCQKSKCPVPYSPIVSDLPFWQWAYQMQSWKSLICSSKIWKLHQESGETATQFTLYKEIIKRRNSFYDLLYRCIKTQHSAPLNLHISSSAVPMRQVLNYYETMSWEFLPMLWDLLFFVNTIPFHR